jgi:hypothetical protein
MRKPCEMLDPNSTKGVTLGDWLSFCESLRGERYISLDGLDEVFSASKEASFFTERTFYDGMARRFLTRR